MLTLIVLLLKWAAIWTLASVVLTPVVCWLIWRVGSGVHPREL